MANVTQDNTATTKAGFFTVRLTESERSLQKSAASIAGVSEGEFVRSAVTEKIERLIDARIGSNQ